MLSKNENTQNNKHIQKPQSSQNTKNIENNQGVEISKSSYNSYNYHNIYNTVHHQKIHSIQNIIEAILFASGEPVKIKTIANVLNISIKECEEEIKKMMKNYKKSKRGIKLIQIEESFQFCTNPEYIEYIKKIYEIPKKKGLSPTLLETLAIIAYKQPVTKSEIESIRGVNSDHSVNTLVKQGLVEEKGRLEAPGKPILFGTTNEFLKYFEFNKLSDFKDIIKK